jgi:hypothetical protein
VSDAQADLVRLLAGMVVSEAEWRDIVQRRAWTDGRRAGYREGFRAALDEVGRDVARALEFRPACACEAPPGAVERRAQERPEVIHAAWDVAGIDLAATA